MQVWEEAGRSRGWSLFGRCRAFCDVRMTCQASPWLPNSASMNRPLGGAPRFLKDRCNGALDQTRSRTVNDGCRGHRTDLADRCLRTRRTGRSVRWLRNYFFPCTTIRRMCAAFGLRPHRSQTFKLSSNTLLSIMYAYHRPSIPNRTLVLSVGLPAQWLESRLTLKTGADSASLYCG